MKGFSCFKSSRNLSLETALYSEKDEKVSIVMKQNEYNVNMEKTVDVDEGVSLIKTHNKNFNKERYKKPKNFLNKTNKQQRPLNCCFFTVCVIIILSIFITFIMWTTNWYQMAIYKTLVLDEYNININMWKNPTWQPLLSVYVFNYTNVKAALEGREKPNVEEIGPYVFREKSKKVNVTFHSNGTVSYRLYRNYTFLPELSAGELNDTVQTPNVFLLSAAFLMKGKNKIARNAVSLFINYFVKNSLFIEMQVKNLTMGYENWIANILSSMQSVKEKLPSKYGLLVQRTGVSKEMITMNNGKYNIDLYGVYEHINGNSNLKKWNADECDKLGGTDGTIYPPTLVARRQPLSVFSDGSCRTSKLIYKKEMKTKGIPTVQYVLDPNLFKYKQSDESCFCLKEECPANGTQTISPCTFGTPIFMSYPHFITADQTVRDSVTGLQHEFTKQINYFNIHKDFGVLISGKTAMQINILVQNAESISGIKDGTYLPISWIELDLTSPPENMLSFFYFATYAVKYIEIFLKYGCFIMACICLLYVVYYLYKVPSASV